MDCYWRKECFVSGVVSHRHLRYNNALVHGQTNMNPLNGLALGAFFLISALFFIIRSSPILFHFGCALLIGGFVVWSGRSLTSDFIGLWLLLTLGLILYWFGLVIVRIMLTRSVSLRMLSNYETGQATQIASEGIAGRLADARHFGLIESAQDGYRLTGFGRMIAGIVALSYSVLRIK